MHWIEVLALWVIWWCSAAALSAGHEVRTVRALVLQLGLILVMVSSFVGAIAVYMRPGILPTWMRGFVDGTAIVAGWLYDNRFGIARHVRMIRGGIASIPTRWKALRSRLKVRWP